MPRGGDRGFPFLAGLQFNDAAVLFFERARVGVVGCRFEAYDVAVYFWQRISPQRKAGQRGLVPTEADSLSVGEVVEQHSRVAAGIGGKIGNVDLLRRIGPWWWDDVPGVDAGAGRHIGFGGYGRDRRCDASTGTQQWQADVEVVEHLHGSIAPADVFDFIGPREVVRADRGGERGGKPKALEEDSGLIDDAAKGDGTLFVVDFEFHTVGRRVGDATVERINELAIFVMDGRSVAFESAAAQEFVETVEPPEAGRLCERNECRVDRIARGRLPAQGLVATADTPDSHAARGQHVDGHGTVIDFDDPDAFGAAAAVNAELCLPRRRIVAHIALEHGTIGNDRLGGVNKNMSVHRHSDFSSALVSAFALAFSLAFFFCEAISLGSTFSSLILRKRTTIGGPV